MDGELRGRGFTGRAGAKQEGGNAMNFITIKQPWASAIVLGSKNVEMERVYALEVTP
jgi:hypothetical protein